VCSHKDFKRVLTFTNRAEFEGGKMLDEIFRDMLEHMGGKLEDASRPEMFNTLTQRLEVTNVAYMGINLPRHNTEGFYVHNTYSKEWALRYQTENYVAVDPIMRLGLHSIMPIDWSELGHLTKAQLEFFETSQEYKIGRKGLSIPLRGLHNETAVFTITADLSDKEWQNFKREKLKLIRLTADLVHQSILAENIVDSDLLRGELTDREIQCLRWCAEGKTYQDISDLMKISIRTVRFFLESARAKLSCLNATHTVATALHKGLI
jgi:DNA-binding CsgD family transcriptional regulator